MKKFIFILALLVGSAILVLLSFSRTNPPRIPDISTTIDFSSWEKQYVWNRKKRAFETMSLSGNISPELFYYKSLSPVDGIYYRTTSTTPFSFEKKWGKTIISFGTWVYVLNLQSTLESYELHVADMIIAPRFQWSFLLDTARTNPFIFSLDSFLDIRIVYGDKKNPVTDFILFPSLGFEHNVSNALNLVGADILRVSLLDSIRYIAATTVNDLDMLFRGEFKDINEQLFLIAKKDISDRAKNFESLIQKIKEQGYKKNEESDTLLWLQHIFFVNDTKKEVSLKNLLLQSIFGLIRDPENALHRKNLQNTLSSMKDESSKLYTFWQSVLREYYYISLYIQDTESEDIKKPNSDFASMARTLLWAKNLQAQEYQKNTSRLFWSYYFHALTSEELNTSLEKILARVLETKVLPKNEFLPFAFFLAEYLSHGNTLPNVDTIKIILHLIQVSDDYYVNNQKEKEKIAPTTSTLFYNYNRIYAKLYQVMVDTYTSPTPNGMLLKQSFLSGNIPNISPDFTNSFLASLGRTRTDVLQKKAYLDANTSSIKPDASVLDNYSAVSNTLASFGPLESMFTNYGAYLTNYGLNDENKKAQGILVQDIKELDPDGVTEYFSQFSWSLVRSLKISNNYKEDGYFQISLPIKDLVFSFRLLQTDHTIADISYIDSLGKKFIFPNTTINLDEKKKQLQERMTSESDPKKKDQYDFRNFFEVTFAKKSTQEDVVLTTTKTPDRPPMSSELEIFIQKELLDKDFRNISSFLPILFSNVYASISDGNYIIDLSSITKDFPSTQDAYSTEISGKYVFSTHMFSRLRLQVKKKDIKNEYEFNGQYIEVLPSRIALLSLPQTLKDVGFYIDAVKSQYVSQKSIILDLSNKQVILDGTSYTPKFPIP